MPRDDPEKTYARYVIARGIAVTVTLAVNLSGKPCRSYHHTYTRAVRNTFVTMCNMKYCLGTLYLDIFIWTMYVVPFPKESL